MGLPVLEHLLLLILRLNLGLLELLLHLSFLVRVLNLDVHAAVMLVLVELLHLVLVVFLGDEVVSLALAKNLPHRVELFLELLQVSLLLLH